MFCRLQHTAPRGRTGSTPTSQQAVSRLCKQKSCCQVLRHDPGLSPVCSFVRAHLPRLFLAARITHCERARDRKWARLPRGMAVRVALSVRFAHRAPSSNQNNSSGHSHSEKDPVRVAWAIPAGDTWDIKPCTRACTRWLAPRCCRSCGLRGKRLKRRFAANV